MSNQGNIIVIDQWGDRFMFTTSRWGGGATAIIAQQRLREFHEAYKNRSDYSQYESAEVLEELIKDPTIARPIAVIGNADTPTVTIDFKKRMVTWHWDHNPAESWGWSIDQYRTEDLERHPAHYKNFVD